LESESISVLCFSRLIALTNQPFPFFDEGLDLEPAMNSPEQAEDDELLEVEDDIDDIKSHLSRNKYVLPIETLTLSLTRKDTPSSRYL